MHVQHLRKALRLLKLIIGIAACSATMNIYEDDNAYYYSKPNEINPRALMRPEVRDYRGALGDTVAQANWLELALGTNGRSAGQWDIWSAVYSPQAASGYPRPIWCGQSVVLPSELICQL